MSDASFEALRHQWDDGDPQLRARCLREGLRSGAVPARIVRALALLGVEYAAEALGEDVEARHLYKAVGAFAWDLEPGEAMAVVWAAWVTGGLRDEVRRVLPPDVFAVLDQPNGGVATAVEYALGALSPAVREELQEAAIWSKIRATIAALDDPQRGAQTFSLLRGGHEIPQLQVFMGLQISNTEPADLRRAIVDVLLGFLWS